MSFNSYVLPHGPELYPIHPGETLESFVPVRAAGTINVLMSIYCQQGADNCPADGLQPRICPSEREIRLTLLTELLRPASPHRMSERARLESFRDRARIQERWHFYCSGTPEDDKQVKIAHFS